MTVTYTPEGRSRHRVVLTRDELELTVESARARVGEGPPAATATGDDRFVRNLTLIALLELYAHSESQARLARNTEKRQSFRDHAEKTRGEVEALATLVIKTEGGLTPGWCSICLVQTHHRGSDGPGLDTYICESCGGATTPCAVPRCKHFAARGTGRVTTPRYCAEHVHAIPSFSRQTDRLDSLDEWEAWHTFEVRDAGKLTKAGLAVTGTAVVGAMTFGAAAPAIGGMVGHAASVLGSGATLYGAAATSHGLALLGFGSLAAGGLGMAGGVAVIAAVGTAVGAKGGLRLATAYGNEDPSFGIERVRDGLGPAVVVATGFTTEKQESIDDWYPLIDSRYEGRPVYYVHWGAKERRDLSLWLGETGARVALKKASVEVAKKATKPESVEVIGSA